MLLLLFPTFHPPFLCWQRLTTLLNFCLFRLPSLLRCSRRAVAMPFRGSFAQITSIATGRRDTDSSGAGAGAECGAGAGAEAAEELQLFKITWQTSARKGARRGEPPSTGCRHCHHIPATEAGGNVLQLPLAASRRQQQQQRHNQWQIGNRPMGAPGSPAPVQLSLSVSSLPSGHE